MKQIPLRFFKSFIAILFLTLVAVASASYKSALVSSDTNSKKTILFNEQEITPTVDGFVAQASGNFNATFSYAELKRYNGFNREIYLTYDFSNLTIAAKSAKLKIFCQSFDKFGDLIVCVYCLPEYQTNGLTWATRPTVMTAIANLLINQTEHTNNGLECDISSSLAAVLAP